MDRVAVLSGHVNAPPKDSLSITDNRTGKTIEVKIADKTFKVAEFKQFGLKTYDPGYMQTICCTSKISFIDGDKGILRYRGIPIEQLAEKSSFPETAFLLIHGEFPTAPQLQRFNKDLMRHTFVSNEMANVISAFPPTAHPMGMITALLAATGTMYPEQNPALAGEGIYKDKAVRYQQVLRILGMTPTIAAMCYRKKLGLPYVTPNPDMGYTENFLNMLDCKHPGSPKPHPKLVRALDVLFMLHAEHELNCSTSAVRHLSSSNVEVYTACAGALGALYGPKHGGANEAVLRMLAKIGDVSKVDEFIGLVKQRKATLMGFGHRVYKNFDPRAKLVRQLAEEVFNVCGRDPLIDIAMALEKAALTDEFFIKRKLYPNVDFYSGVIYKAMGIPPEFFTCLFAIPRMAGWLAHWGEWVDDPENRIYRPFQNYQGYGARDYQPVEARSQTIPDGATQYARPAVERRHDIAKGDLGKSYS